MTNYFNSARLGYLRFQASPFDYGEQICSLLVGWVQHVLMPAFPELDEVDCLRLAMECWPDDDKPLIEVDLATEK